MISAGVEQDIALLKQLRAEATHIEVRARHWNYELAAKFVQARNDIDKDLAYLLLKRELQAGDTGRAEERDGIREYVNGH